MRLRSATPADAAVLAAMEATCFAEPWSATAVAEDLAAATCRAWIAEIADAAVGYLLGTQVVDEFTVARIASLPTTRRCGVGRALLQDAMSAAKQEGVTAMFLEVRASNEAAIRLYTSAGFVVTRRRKGYYADGEDALDMRCSLSAEDRSAC